VCVQGDPMMSIAALGNVRLVIKDGTVERDEAR
jgi:hypothetical protein